MSIDGRGGGDPVVAIGTSGGGTAAVISQLADTGNPILVGIVVALVLVVISGLLMRRAHRNYEN